MRDAVLIVLGLALLAAPASPSSGLPTQSWYEGADGMERAIAEARQHEKPLIVYFRTDWCGYCRQFENELLATEEVEIFMNKVVRVTINPETGPREADLANMYGVQGFPAIFVHPATLELPLRIQRMVVEKGKPRLQTPVEFVQTLSRSAHK